MSNLNCAAIRIERNVFICKYKQTTNNMKQEKRIELLCKARNILHKQENGEVLTGNEIVAAHDYVDMVLDDMVSEDFLNRKNPSPKLFTVTYCYGQEVYSANSAEELFVYLNRYQWHGPVDISDIQEVTLKKGVNFIGGHVE